MTDGGILNIIRNKKNFKNQKEVASDFLGHLNHLAGQLFRKAALGQEMGGY